MSEPSLIPTEAIIWRGEKDRMVELYRHCKCVTCQAAAPNASVGFLSGSDHNGIGYTIALFSEDLYQAILRSGIPEHEPLFGDDHGEEWKQQ